MQDALFRKVEPMKGAVKLVRGLVHFLFPTTVCQC